MSASGESSTTMHRLLHASGSHPIPTPYDPKRVGKRVKVRLLSCRVSMTFRVVRTNQYNQDLGLIHSINGNHLESPNEGSSIDHQSLGVIASIVCLLVVNAGQPSCSARGVRRRLVSARSFSRWLVLCKVLLLVLLTSVERRRLSKWQRRVLMLLLVSAGGSALRCFVYCCWMTSSWLRGRAVIPHSHLPAGIVATMRRVVNYHSSWARQQQVELFGAAGKWGLVSWRVAHYHTVNSSRGHYSLSIFLGAMFEFLCSLVLLSVLGFDPMSLWGLVCFFVALFSGNPGSTAGRGFNPAGGAPGGITDSVCKNQLVVVSIQYGPFNPYIPIRSTTIGKSRVAIDPIAMHTSWRSNSDIASVTRVSMTFRVVRTNQYNQDLGLIHSINGNHLESPNEGSSIDHQLAVVPQPLWLRNHNSGFAHRIMVRGLATSPHDPLGITDSACKNQLVVVSVQYGPFNPYIPIRSTTIGKSRVAKDPIAMHTFWRSNSDIVSVTR
ncbi:hypothetical protein F511_15030 [Dorcoceras hygrometricum]|uniref:Uncharacterized protein n=1 Tax=Dorcoceras hygrometricum TaxID=472368 RepID=A0A2Z7D7P1_9LAMI|nr:hypothetical protein F511_15030 [Dorcoceras hygrometricum]